MFDIVYAATEAVNEAEAATGPIGALGINLKLFIAQLINFAVILLVLWRWAYRPLLSIMHERQKTIQDSLDNAKKIETRLGQAEQEYQAKLREARKEAVVVMRQAEEEAAAHMSAMKQKTETEVAKLVQTAKAKITEEKDAAVRDVRAHAAGLITGAIEKVLGETMNAERQEKLVAQFLKEK